MYGLETVIQFGIHGPRKIIQYPVALIRMVCRGIGLTLYTDASYLVRRRSRFSVEWKMMHGGGHWWMVLHTE